MGGRRRNLSRREGLAATAGTRGRRPVSAVARRTDSPNDPIAAGRTLREAWNRLRLVVPRSEAWMVRSWDTAADDRTPPELADLLSD